LPGDLKVCYFVNSGSEANDLALLLARAYTGNYDMIALRNAYHGGNASGMAVTAHSTWKYNVPHSFGVHHAIAPYPYRGPYGYDDADAGRKYADEVKSLIDYATPGRVAAFIAESIQGVGGFVDFRGYLNTLANASARRAAYVLRTKCRRALAHGHTFLGLQTQGVIPHRHNGEGHRQWLSARGGGHYAEDCGFDGGQSAFQHVRRQPGSQRHQQGSARSHRERSCRRIR
jgi:alanine-glyoxylate transaminase/(R)-3-amino-2-methylpropionate-pyruvate transaminase